MAWTVNDPLEKAHLRYSLGVQCLTDTLERYMINILESESVCVAGNFSFKCVYIKFTILNLSQIYICKTAIFEIGVLVLNT